MSHPFFSARRPQVFAHRGGSALAPENTMAAFDRGLALGADGLELDVRLSRDGVVVVHHDRTLERTTNLSGPIANHTADELARADAGYSFLWGPPADGPIRLKPDPTSGGPIRLKPDPTSGGPIRLKPDPTGGGPIRLKPDPTAAEFPFRGRGITIPTLAAVLARYRDVPVIVELKVNHPDLARAVVGVVREADAIDRVCLGSFGFVVLREARRLEPALATSAAREEVRLALYRSWCRWPVVRVRYGGYQVPEWSGRTHVVSLRFVEDAHAAGLGVQVWTVDTEPDAGRLLDWGVDALITDRPDIIVPFVRGRRTARG
ncbi:MAG TPA: glycerophosphodiester phosphodiesterase [Vicinamibacterales bacterium]